MSPALVPFDIAVVLAFSLIGAWLERINGKHGFMDELLAPFPLGLTGLSLVFLERLGT
jgi:hypothetical protein